MKTTRNDKAMATAAKKISGVAYVGLQAHLVRQEGRISAKLADLFFQCALEKEDRTQEAWDKIVVAAMGADATIAEAIEFGEDE